MTYGGENTSLCPISGGSADEKEIGEAGGGYAQVDVGKLDVVSELDNRYSHDEKRLTSAQSSFMDMPLRPMTWLEHYE